MTCDRRLGGDHGSAGWAEDALPREGDLRPTSLKTHTDVKRSEHQPATVLQMLQPARTDRLPFGCVECLCCVLNVLVVGAQTALADSL